MERKHSKLGIASLILTSVAAMGGFGLIALVAIIKAVDYGHGPGQRLGHVLAVLCLAALVCTNLIAVGLGVGGMMQPERKKSFGILGVVLASLQLLVVLVIVVAAQ